MKLIIELVPKTSWYDNVRSRVTQEEWDIIRKNTYKKAGYKCDCCGTKDRLECHEIWHYDDKTHRQTLIGLTALCGKCHKVKHIGRSMLQGELEECIAHLMKVNKLTEDETIEYIDECFKIWQERSRHNWKVDITYIETLADRITKGEE